MTVLALQRPGGTNFFCVLRCAPRPRLEKRLSACP